METKSPIRDKLLRNPGQKLDEELDVLFNEEFMSYYFVAAIMIVLTFLEFYRSYKKIPYSPTTYFILCIIIVPYCVYKLFKLKKIAKQLTLGRDGEKAVGQYLEYLRETGAKVFHDIQGNGFNLDHVVISSKGVFVIETKTYSKPAKGEAIIKYDGENVFLYGKTPDRNPIIQVTAASKWLSNELNQSTGRKINVKPVVLFPGWFVKPTKEAKTSNVWVLNPKALPDYIDNAREILKSEDVNLLSHHLSRYIRTCNN